jgi:hypothetical protein
LPNLLEQNQGSPLNKATLSKNRPTPNVRRINHRYSEKLITNEVIISSLR